MSTGRAFLVYTGLRIALLLAVGGLLYLTGARGFLLFLLAFVVSGALSLVWLDKPRGQMSQGVGRAIGRVNDRIDRAASAEDVDEPASGEPASAGDRESDGQPEPEAEADQQQTQ